MAEIIAEGVTKDVDGQICRWAKELIHSWEGYTDWSWRNRETVNWTNLAQDKNKKLAFVKTAMIFRIPQKTGNFLSSSKTH